MRDAASRIEDGAVPIVEGSQAIEIRIRGLIEATRTSIAARTMAAVGLVAWIAGPRGGATAAQQGERLDEDRGPGENRAYGLITPGHGGG